MKSAQNFISLQRIGLFACLFLALLAVGHLQGTRSASLSMVSVTLSDSRPSFRGALAAGNSVGTSKVTINTTDGAYPSSSSAQLVVGDTLRIGEAGSLGSYTITEVIDNGNDNTFNVTPVLLAGDTDVGDDVIATSAADLTVRLTTKNAIENGAFRILVPADSDNASATDGIPDGGGFDFGTSAPTVTCPTDIPGEYDFVAGTATASAVTIGATDYHAYECRYSGPGAIGTVFDGTTHDAFVISSVINPAPTQTGHIIGYADTYNVVVRQLDTTYTTADATTVSIGVVEAVRVTATVAPQITFQISGVSNGTSVCGATTDVDTTASLVPFGTLSILSFTNAAQGLAVSTNAPNGYAVTAVENDQLGLDGGTCLGDNTGAYCIPDSVGDTSGMSDTASDEWSANTVKGFAYTLEEVNTTGAVPSFEYDTSGGNCDGSGDCFRQFPDAEDSEAPQNLFTSNTVADNDNVYICYRSVISAIQAAGDYTNYLTYTATATF